MYRVAPSAIAPGSASGGRMVSTSASTVRRSWDVKNRPRAAAQVRSTRVQGAPPGPRRRPERLQELAAAQQDRDGLDGCGRCFPLRCEPRQVGQAKAAHGRALTGTAREASRNGASASLSRSLGLAIHRDHSRTTEPKVVLQGDRGVLHLALVRLPAQLPVELRALREARGTEGVAL